MSRTKNTIEYPRHKKATDLLIKHGWRSLWEVESIMPPFTLQLWAKSGRLVIVQFMEGDGVDFYFNDPDSIDWATTEVRLAS